MSTDIVPFIVHVDQADLDDLHRRLDNIRWPDQLDGVGWSQGTPRDYLYELADYWRTSYDWRRHEGELNAFPQFTTEVDGTNVHFIHVRSPEPDAVPLLLVHGWPGSVLEYLELIGPLTDPRAYGADPATAFHVVLPSMPGYTFSGPVPDSGWGSQRIGRALAELMGRLGYDTFIAHGGDWGESVVRDIAIDVPDRVRGVHITTFFSAPPYAGEVDPTRLDDADKARLATHLTRDWSIGYFHLLSSRPQTAAYGWSDSPVTLLAWMVEKFHEWTDWELDHEEAVDRDHILTNVSMYWFTNTANSAGRLYWEEAQTGRGPGPRWNPVPTGVGVFPKEMSVPIRALVETTNNIVYWAEYDRGGHFAALEEPDLVVADLRQFLLALDPTRSVAP